MKPQRTEIDGIHAMVPREHMAESARKARIFLRNKLHVVKLHVD